MALSVARRRDTAALGKEQVRSGHAAQTHKRAAARLPTLLRQGPADRQAGEILRERDNQREDPALLRQRDSILGGSIGAVVQGGREAHQHPRCSLCGTRLTERHHHRTSRCGTEEAGIGSAQVARTVLRQEDLSGTVR